MDDQFPLSVSEVSAGVWTQCAEKHKQVVGSGGWAASVAAPGQAARPAQTRTIAQHVGGRGHGRRVPGLRADQELALQLAQVAAVAGELRDPGAQGPEGRAADYR